MFRPSLSLAVALAASAVAHGQAGRPNVVVIISDDLGYADLSINGSPDLRTPHLDALARSGVRFTSAYATGPICGPSRAGIHSGRYQQKHSYDGNPGGNTGLSLNEATLAETFRAAGYKTGAIGKWHLGSQPQFQPQNRGFDEFFGFYGAMHAYVPGEVAPEARMTFERGRRPAATDGAGPASRPSRGFGGEGATSRPSRGFGGDGATSRPARGFGGGGGIGGQPGKLVRGTAEVDEPAYLTDAFAREAAAFIDRHQNEPYFLYVAFNASHSPLQPPQKYLDRYPSLTGKRQAYAATTSAFDDAVGEILAKVKQTGDEANTLVVYINDNGGPINDIAADNTPLGGAKFSLWEGGIRVNSFIRWPAQLPAGAVRSEPVSGLDLFPTLVAAANLKSPKGKRFDGVNLLPILRDEPGAPSLVDRTLYWRSNQLWAIRKGDWKLTQPERGEAVQLFNLAQDIGETHDLAAEHPDVVQRLTADWQAWNRDNLPVPDRGIAAAGQRD